MTFTTERKITFSVISANRDFNEEIARLIRGVSAGTKTAFYYFESSFIESAAGGTQTDVIISDRTESIKGWKEFYSTVKKLHPDSLLIFILPEGDMTLNVEMIRAGVYDVISYGSLEKLNPLVHKIIRDIDHHSKLQILSREKDISDHIVNCSRSMLSIINRNYEYEKVNSTFCDAHNVVVNNIVGKTLSEVWGTDTFYNKIKDNIDLCFKGNLVRYEAHFNTPGFGERYYEVIFRPIVSGDGDIANIIAETFDITSLKHSQKAVNEMEDEFRILETNLPIGFLRCEPDGTIIHANKAFIRIVACDEEAIVAGLNIKEFYTEKGLFDIHLRQLLNEKIKTFGRVPLFACGGVEIACRISGFVVADEAGNPSYIDFAFEDSSRELMLENRLLQAQKLETIGALAGGLAHDFNNILGTIFGYSELLLDEVPRNSPMSEKLVKIISAITRARSLTNQILTFSRQVEQQKIAVNIYEVLKETIGFIQSGKPRNITIADSITDLRLMVFADPTQLFRVFLNLMTNGIQAMEEKGGTLTIGLDSVEGRLLRNELNRDIVADEYALVTIEDTGIGMDPSVMQRIFEPYFTTKQVGRGTGLGLSVVHGIVAEIEGEITVKSRKGAGSVFSLYLPVAKEVSETSSGIPEKHILIITGNLHESRILSLALEKSGYKPEFASDLKRLHKTIGGPGDVPDAIIYMDDSMSVTAEEIVFLYAENRLKIPLILITDADHYASKEKLLNSGVAKQVLMKPVSLREIHNAIQMALI